MDKKPRMDTDAPENGPTHHMKLVASHMKCPITQSLMVEPVVAADGCMYERAAIVEWLKRSRTSPVTRTVISKSLSAECTGIRNAISDLVDTGLLDREACIEWHVARGKLVSDDACAKRHFEKAVKLGCTQTGRVLEMQAKGIELRKRVIEFRQHAAESDLEADWINRLLNADLPLDVPGNSQDGSPPRGSHYAPDNSNNSDAFHYRQLRSRHGMGPHRTYDRSAGASPALSRLYDDMF